MIVENVVSDAKSLKEVSQALGLEPVLIQASRQCCAPRERVFWCNFEMRCTADEKIIKRSITGRSIWSSYWLR